MPANPFDVIPANLFNLFSTQGYTTLQPHYMAILLRLYTLAEFNRFGLTREAVIAEIVDYLKTAGAEAEVAAAMAAEADPSRDPEPTPPTGQKLEHEYASYLLRRLAETGWVEREQHADYSETIILPDYAFTLLEALRAIQEKKTREVAGQLYTERAARGRTPAELLQLQFDDYAQTLGHAYHALKTSDHVSRYRRDIVGKLRAWQRSREWLDRTAEELAAQGRLTPAQAAGENNRYIQFIIHQLEGLDPLLEEIDRRHAQYLRTSLRQIRYQLVSADGGFKDRLVSLARGLAEMQNDGENDFPA